MAKDNNNGANLGFESELWRAADALRSNMDAAEYKHVVLGIDGTIGDEPDEFRIAVGKAAQAKHRFQVGMEASGQAVTVPDPRL